MISKIVSFFKKLSGKKQPKLPEPKPVNIQPVKQNSVVILVPVGHHIEPPVDEALRKLESVGYTVWRKYGWSAIDQGRCAMAQEALDAGFEHLFWIDADVTFWPYDVEKIVNMGLPFVSAPYSVKGWPVLTTQFVDKEVKLGSDGGLYEVKYAATGFMYTHRSVYESITKHYNMQRVKIWGGQYNVYPYFYPMIYDNEYIGEDFSFCHRATQSGIKLYCDTRVVLAHIGKYSYGLSFLNNGPSTEPGSLKYTQPEDCKFS